MPPATEIARLLMTLAVLKDGNGADLPRKQGFADVVATAVSEHPEFDWRKLAAALDVIGAHESGYDAAAVGDSGKSCGAWQTPCDETPMPAGWRTEYEPARAAAQAARAMPATTEEERAARDAALQHAREMFAAAHKHRLAAMTTAMRVGQARVASKWIIASFTRCPEHPISLYATGTICGAVRIADLYARQVEEERAALPE